MADIYKIQTFHAVAHIQPTLSYGTAVATNPVGNIRTLNPNSRAHLKGGATTFEIRLDWDRGASGGTVWGINCLSFAGCTYDSGTVLSFDLDAADDSGYSVNLTSLYVGGDFNVNGPRMYLFNTNTQRYLRLTITAADTTTVWKFGTISIGQCIGLGSPLLGQRLSGTNTSPTQFVPPQEGGLIWERAFRLIQTSLVETLFDYWHPMMVLNQDGSGLDGFGGGAGTIPGAVGVFTDSSDAISNSCYYGNIALTSREWAAKYSEVGVRVVTPRIGVL